MDEKLERQVDERKKRGRSLLEDSVYPIVVFLYRINQTRMDHEYATSSFLKSSEGEELYGYLSVNENCGEINIKYSCETKDRWLGSKKIQSGLRKTSIECNGSCVFESHDGYGDEAYMGVKEISIYLPGEWEERLPEILKSSEDEYNILSKRWKERNSKYWEDSLNEGKRIAAERDAKKEAGLRKNFGL